MLDEDMMIDEDLMDNYYSRNSHTDTNMDNDYCKNSNYDNKYYNKPTTNISTPSTGILSAPQILNFHAQNKIVYVSAKDKNPLSQAAKNQSVDVNLGEWLYFPNKQDLLDIAKLNDLTVSSKSNWLSLEQLTIDNKDNNFKLIIPRNVFFLCHTEQFIGTTPDSNIYPQFFTRSTIARLGLFHTLAGWGDIGYFNRWCMEFYTVTEITIVPNMRVGQISFTQTANTKVTNNDSNNKTMDYTTQTGNYQLSNNLAQTILNWTKEDILPKENNIY